MQLRGKVVDIIAFKALGELGKKNELRHTVASFACLLQNHFHIIAGKATGLHSKGRADKEILIAYYNKPLGTQQNLFKKYHSINHVSDKRFVVKKIYRSHTSQ